MGHCITRHLIEQLEPLLRFLLPGTGRRRRSGTAGGKGRPPVTPYAHAHTHAPTAPRTAEPPLHGENHRLVRPYLVAHERREEARRQRARRRALWLAVHGIDVGPRVIHSVEVNA